MAQVEFNVPGPGTYLIEADPSLPPLPSPGQASDVLNGEQFYDNEGNAITGTMPNNPAEAVVIPGGGSYTIPQGYHTGQGTVTSSGSVLPTLTDPADAGEIVSGKEVIDQNGAVMTGTMPSNPAISETLEAGESYQVPAGYTPGGTVQAASLVSQTPGTATQDDIIQGQTAWVNGQQITGALEPGSDTSDATATAADILEGETAYVATGKVSGTMPNNGAVQETLEAGGQYTIPAGYHNGQGTVMAESLEDQTAGTATAPDILNGKTAWVNGAQVTGSMPDNGAVTKEMTAGETYNIPAGYHNGSGTVTAPTVASETPGTAVVGDLRQGKTAWVDGEQLTGTVPDVEAATPTISVSAGGLITAQTEQAEGFVAEATKAASQQLPVQGAQTITPGTSQQTINGGVYLTGAQTIQGDANLVPDNIKENVSIFGVTGTYAGEQTSFAVPLTVNVDTGATVTAVNGDTTLTATSVNGQANFVLTSGGDWNLSATLDDRSGSTTVTIQNFYSTTIRLQTPDAVFGVSWDMSTSSTALTRLTPESDPNGYVTTEISGGPSPSVGGGTGSSPFDSFAPWNGMRRVTDPQAGELVSIPKYWYLWDLDGITLRLYISSTEKEGFFVSPAHCDREDGAGERNVVYVGRYHCASDYRSTTGVAPLSVITRPDARSGIHSLGTDIWQWDWAMNWTIKMLYLVEFADWNSQGKIGYGCGNNSYAQQMGYTDSMPYHTGTTQSSRTAYGLGTQYRYIEGLWDNVQDWVDGCYCNSTGINIILNPSNFSDTGGGTTVGIPVSGFPDKADITIALGNQWIRPISTGGSIDTYIPDTWLFKSSDRTLYVGGRFSYYDDGMDYGLFYVNTESNVYAERNYIGCRLMRLT